jgi:hypothetical protein
MARLGAAGTYTETQNAPHLKIILIFYINIWYNFFFSSIFIFSKN